MMKQLLETLRTLAAHRTYVIYSLAYGLSTLIVPLGVQFLVNNLALSGIWLNTTAFLLFIVLGLALGQTIKHSQLILVETLQRELFCLEIGRWRSASAEDSAPYYFEVMNLMKAFSKAYSNLIELALIMAFGLVTMIFFHPTFIVVALLLLFSVYLTYRSSAGALRTSIAESNVKYELYDKVAEGQRLGDGDVYAYLSARQNHFGFIRSTSFKIGALVVASQALLLALGCYLIKINQLSVGQLVSAEIIVSGVFGSLSKLPRTLEAVYDYETSKYKIEKAFRSDAHE